MSRINLKKTRWRRALPLAAILLLALVLRLIALNQRPLWYDEAFSILFAEESLETMIAGTLGIGGAAAEEHPLLYYAGLRAWMGLVGRSPAAARTFSALLGTATVGVAFFLTRRLFDRRTALAAATLATLSPFHIYYSQEARMYALLGLGALATIFFFVQAWQRGGRGYWLAFALAGAVSLYTHNLFALFLLCLDLWILWRWWRKRELRRLGPIIMSHLLMLLLFSPWLVVLPRQLSKIGQAYWVTRPGLGELIQTALIFHFAYDNQALPGALLPPALLFSLLIPALLALEGRRRPAEVPGATTAPFSLLIFLSAGPPLLAFFISLAQPIYVIRALLPSALIYYILVARFLLAGRLPRLLYWAVWLPALLIATLSLANHYLYAQFPRAPFAEAATFAVEWEEEPVVVHSNKLTFLPMYYYEPLLDQRFIADEPGSASDTLGASTQEALGIKESASLESATAGEDRIVFVIFRQALAESEESGGQHPHLEWLKDRYDVSEIREFEDLRLYLLERR